MMILPPLVHPARSTWYFGSPTVSMDMRQDLLFFPISVDFSVVLALLILSPDGAVVLHSSGLPAILSLCEISSRPFWTDYLHRSLIRSSVLSTWTALMPLQLMISVLSLKSL